MTSVEAVDVETQHGLARVHLHRRSKPRATVVLTHGAGGGIHAPDLAYLAEMSTDVDVALVEMPWRVAGKRIAPRPIVLDQCWRDVFAAQPWGCGPVIAGGRSAGARVALRTVAETRCAGVLALAFPLHPPGKPERSRASELDVSVPLVVVQGERDPFGRPEEFPAIPLVMQPHAGHELRGEPTLLQALTTLMELCAAKGW